MFFRLFVFLILSAPLLSMAQNWKTPKTAIEEGLIKAPQTFIEVALLFDQESSTKFKLLSMRQLRTSTKGYQISYSGDESFTLELLDQNKTLLYSLSFRPPLDLRTAIAKLNDPLPHEHLTLKSVRFVLLVPTHTEATQLRILDKGIPLLEVPIKKQKASSPKNNFRTIRGSEIKKTSSWQSGTKLFKTLIGTILSTIVGEAHASTGTLDIAIIGDKYSDLNLFRNDASTIITQMLNTEPFKSKASQILFHVVDNTTSLQCKYDTTIARLLVCDNTLVYMQLNSAGVPYDKAMVIVNSATYGGSGGPVSVVYNGSYAAVMMIHEFGHSLAGLLDEYNLYTTNGTVSNTTQENCYAGTPPNVAWPNVTLASYTLGCRYPNWYRSTPDSVMYSLNTSTFNEVSVGIVNKAIDRYISSSTTVDVTPPIVSFVSPINGAVISGTIQMQVNATDNTSISTLMFQLNGITLSTLSAAPYVMRFDSTTVADGTHSLKAIAIDSAGNTSSTTISITIKNMLPDSIAPEIQISSPIANSTLKGKNLTVTVQATDNRGVVLVKLFANGKAVASSNIAPFSMKWNIAKLPSGVYTLEVRAYDAAGNEGISPSVTVYR